MLAGGAIAVVLLIRSTIRFHNRTKAVPEETLFQTMLSTEKPADKPNGRGPPVCNRPFVSAIRQNIRPAPGLNERERHPRGCRSRAMNSA